MECSQARKIIYDSAGVEADIPAQFRAEFKKHLAGCKSCAAQYDALTSLLKDLSALPGVSAPADFLEKVRKRLKGPSAIGKARNAFLRMFGEAPLYKLAASAAAVVVVVVAAQVALRETHFQKELWTPSPMPSPALAPPAAPADNFKYPASGSPDSPKLAASAPAGSSDPVIAPGSPDLQSSPAPSKPKQRAGGKIMQYNAPGQASPNANTHLQPREEERQPEPVVLTLKIPHDSSSGKSSTAPAILDKAEEPSVASSAPPMEKSISRARPGKESVKPADRSLMDPTRRAFSEVKRLVLLSNGEIISEQSTADAEKQVSILAEIPAHNYEAFLVQLRRFGEIDFHGESPQEPPPQADLPIRISIIFNQGS